jgi:ElaB/YqjD/DUF883 family membrane-anchored ribosome-binding protein
MKYVQSFVCLAIAVFACALIGFANVATADAAQSNLKKGMEQLPGVQTKAEDVTKASPYSNQNKVDYKSNQGLNEVQGNSDFNRMYKNAGTDTLPAVTQVQKAVGKVGSNIDSATKGTQDGINSVVDKAGDAANYVKNKSGDVLNSVTEKVGDTAESIKAGTKSLVGKGVSNLKDNSTFDTFQGNSSVQDTPESIKFNNVRAFKERDGDFKDQTNDLQIRR